MNKTALILAFVVASLGGVLLYIYLHRFEQESSGGQPVSLLLAIKPVEPGMLLTEEMLATRSVPQAYVENRAVRATERAKVVGLRVATPIQANQTLMWTDLAIATDDRRDLSSLVQPGMRAVSVRAANDDKSFSLIRPGDRVDVVATMPSGADQRSSIVLLQNVLVLAVGLDTGSDTSGARGPTEVREHIVSLSLSLTEAQLVALAIEKGRVTLALRNPADVRVTEGIADMNSSALTDKDQRNRAQHVRRPPSGPVRLESPGAP